VHYNIATGNARVGWQADGAVITGGLVIDGHTGDTPPPGHPGPSRPGDTSTPPVRNIVTGSARVGRQTGGTPAGDTGPGQGGDTRGAAYYNIATGNARVGVQAREVVITGGLTFGGRTGDTPPPGDARVGRQAGGTPAGDATPGQAGDTTSAAHHNIAAGNAQVGVLGPRNIAGNGDVTGVQAQAIHGTTRTAKDHDQ
jgi:hypothetical protein